MQSSRRRFIRTATGGVGLAWGGLRITAGYGSGTGGGALSYPAPNSVPAGQFLYGSQFYRPPNPPRAMRREMLRTIAEQYKFNLVRIWPNWDYVNPEPDKWIFDEVDEVMGYCDEFGLKVLCGIMLELTPWWLEQDVPRGTLYGREGPAGAAGPESKQRHRWLAGTVF